jgi:GNAT superfamily N-acetyltransferase
MIGQAAREFLVEPLGRQHDRTTFSCGVESLDHYLKAQASQDMRRKANAVFVIVKPETPATIVGYFTLCAHALTQGEVPEAARKHIPRYPLISATLIGRLAVRAEYQGHGIGAQLLARALRMAYESAARVGSSIVVVDAIDERAALFYRAFGFIRLVDSMRLILPTQTIAGLVAVGPGHAGP